MSRLPIALIITTILLPASLTATPVLVLHMDGNDPNFIDSSPSTHTITPVGGATQTTTDSAVGIGSGDFNGTASHLTVGSHTDFAFGTNDFTFGLWIKPNDINRQQTLYGWRDDGNTSRWNEMDIISGEIRFYVNAGLLTLSTGSVLTMGVWQHVALTRAGDTWTLYHNGLALDTGVVSHAYSTAAQTPQLLTWFGSSTYTYDGLADEFVIDNGVALPNGGFSAVPEPRSYIFALLLLVMIIYKRNFVNHILDRR